LLSLIFHLTQKIQQTARVVPAEQERMGVPDLPLGDHEARHVCLLCDRFIGRTAGEHNLNRLLAALEEQHHSRPASEVRFRRAHQVCLVPTHARLLHQHRQSFGLHVKPLLLQ
jgi:hypothetical protein